MKGFSKLIGLGILLLIQACIRPFVPDLEKYDELLVVDGGINDGPGPYLVKISKSARTKERSQEIPFSRCRVVVEDDLGNSFTFQETMPGRYETDSADFRAVPGRAYKLKVVTPKREEYESNPEILPRGLKIEAITHQVEHKIAPDLFFGRDGYQFYVDVEATPTTNNYLMWQMQSTFKFKADYGIAAFYAGALHYVLDNDTLRTCYRTKDVLDIFLLNTNELQQRKVNHFPLHYEDNYTKALSIRYSLNVKQFTIGKSAYEYWSTIKKIRDSGGELYTQQPFQVKNNLKCISDPEKSALGYFMLAGISEKRVFITPIGIILRHEKCLIVKPQKYPVDRVKDRPDLWPFFFAYDEGGMWYVEQECVDCRRTGTLTKPPFWED